MGDVSKYLSKKYKYKNNIVEKICSQYSRLHGQLVEEKEREEEGGRRGEHVQVLPAWLTSLPWHPLLAILLLLLLILLLLPFLLAWAGGRLTFILMGLATLVFSTNLFNFRKRSSSTDM